MASESEIDLNARVLAQQLMIETVLVELLTSGTEPHKSYKVLSRQSMKLMEELLEQPQANRDAFESTFTQLVAGHHERLWSSLELRLQAELTRKMK